MCDGAGVGTRWCEAPGTSQAASAGGAFARRARGTPLGHDARLGAGGIFIALATNKVQKSRETSGSSPVCGLRGGSIRKKIIGHSVRSVVARIDSGKRFRQAGGAFALLQKPARQHGRGGFLQPLIHQGRYLLAEIGGVRQTREFVALQGVFGSGKKELPGRLRGTCGHKTSVIRRCEY